MSFLTRFIKPLLNNRGCFGGSVQSAPLPAPAPQQANPAVKTAEDEERRRRRAAASNTLLTGGSGVAMPAMQPKSLLGSS